MVPGPACSSLLVRIRYPSSINLVTLPDQRQLFFLKKHEFDRSRLSLIAFVQHDKTKSVLRSVYLKVDGGSSG